MKNKKNVEGCQMSLIKNVRVEDVKSQVHAKAFMTELIIH